MERAEEKRLGVKTRGVVVEVLFDIIIVVENLEKAPAVAQRRANNAEEETGVKSERVRRCIFLD